jgi:hypothetical protein
MNAGPAFEYLWQDGPKKKPIKVSRGWGGGERERERERVGELESWRGGRKKVGESREEGANLHN